MNFLSLKTDANVIICWHLEKPLKKRAGSGSGIQRCGSVDPEPYQNDTGIWNTEEIAMAIYQKKGTKRYLAKAPVGLGQVTPSQA
jgi:hypothetical protein